MSTTEARIGAFQKKAGISVPPATTIKLWSKLQELAFEAIRVAELEKSGIRDGNSFWNGGDVLGGTFSNIENIVTRLRAAYTIEPELPPEFADSIHW
jgi:hypothetical protein